MALSAVHTFVSGSTLYAQQLNDLNNNILQNPIALISPTTGPINFALQSHVNLPVTALSATSGSTGSVPTIISPGVVGWSTTALSTGPQLISGGYYASGLTGSVTSGQTGSFQFDQASVVTTARTQSFQVNATSSFTVNVGTTGPGGRDQAGQFASTYIHAYVITTGLNSTTPVGLLSSVAPPVGPTMPTSYSAWAYIAPFLYSPASTGFSVSQLVVGNQVYFTAHQPVLTDGRALAEATVDYSALVPPNALTVTMAIKFYGGQSHAFQYRVVSGANWLDNSVGWSSPSDSIYQVTIPNQARRFFYVWGADPGATAGFYASILGYKVPNGGE